MTTREQYNARFDSLNHAIAFENAALSIGRQFLPEFARAVLDDNSIEPAPEYWAWLIEATEAVDEFESE